MGLCGGSRDVAAVTEGAPGTRGVGWLCRASGPPSGAELPRPPRVPSFPGPGWCRERPRHAVPSRSCLGGAGVQGPALTHTAWPWSCRRAHGSSSEVRFGAGKSRVSAARKPRLSHVVIGGVPLALIPGASLALFVPLLTGSHTQSPLSPVLFLFTCSSPTPGLSTLFLKPPKLPRPRPHRTGTQGARRPWVLYGSEGGRAGEVRAELCSPPPFRKALLPGTSPEGGGQWFYLPTTKTLTSR